MGSLMNNNRLLVLGLGAAMLASAGCVKTGASTASGQATAPATYEDGWPVMPVPGPAPSFAVPGATEFTLSNGIPVTYVQRGTIPLVQLSLNFFTGSMADPAGKEGLAAFTADLLNEGTSKRDALQISDDLQRMATGMSTSAGLSSSSLSINALEDKLDESLALARDLLSDPVFKQEDIDRVRADRKNRLLTSRDQPGTINYLIFSELLYGDSYAGRPASGSADSLDAITREDMVAWHKAAWQPSNAGLVVVGRLPVDEMKSHLESGLGSWSPEEAEVPAAVLKTPEAPKGVTIYWVDRPGAAQSYIQVGSIAPAFSEDKHEAWSLANMVLGGQFSSRINLNLREDKGYTYGARSSVWDGKHGGMFRARSSVRTATTGPSLFEFFKELEDIVGDRPITQDEFDAVVSRAKQGYPGRFENMGGVLGAFSGAQTAQRPEGWLASKSARVDAVSLQSAQAAINELVDPENLIVVVVGDWNAVVESPESAEGTERPIEVTVGDQVRALRRGEVVFLDEDGNPAAEPAR